MSENPLINQTTWEPSYSQDGAADEAVSPPHLTILSHSQIDRVGERVALWPLLHGKKVLLARNQPEFAPPGQGFSKPLLDPYLSRKSIELYTNRNGALCIQVPPGINLKVEGQPVGGNIELLPDALRWGVTLALENRVSLLLHAHQDDAGTGPDMGMIGCSSAMARLRLDVARAALLEAPVLVRGETGAGKELVAQALHREGPRAGGPFVSVSLATVPPSLAASELFGAGKGAFTGASVNTRGFFRKAHGGVLFLDEIGEVSPEIQAMLLRVLETGQVLPLGSQTPQKVDVRLVSATDADLDSLMEEKQFKAPLLHRLAGFEIHLPPLRQRRDDIARLFLHFSREVLAEMGLSDRLQTDNLRAPPWLPTDLCCALVRYSWPGNIRQLRNVVRQLMVDNRDRRSLVADERLMKMLGTPSRVEAQQPAAKVEPAGEEQASRRKPGTVSERELREILAQSKWEYKTCADLLGITRPSLYYLMNRYGIPTVVDLESEAIRTCYRRQKGDLEAMAQQLQVSKRALKQRLKILKLVYV